MAGVSILSAGPVARCLLFAAVILGAQASPPAWAVTKSIIAAAQPHIDTISLGMDVERVRTLARQNQWTALSVVHDFHYDNTYQEGPAQRFSGTFTAIALYRKTANDLKSKILLLKKHGNSYSVIHIVNNPNRYYLAQFDPSLQVRVKSFVARGERYAGEGSRHYDYRSSEVKLEVENPVIDGELHIDSFLKVNGVKYHLIADHRKAPVGYFSHIFISQDTESLAFISMDENEWFLVKFMKISTDDGEAYKAIGYEYEYIGI